MSIKTIKINNSSSHTLTFTENYSVGKAMQKYLGRTFKIKKSKLGYYTLYYKRKPVAKTTLFYKLYDQDYITKMSFYLCIEGKDHYWLLFSELTNFITFAQRFGYNLKVELIDDVGLI